MTGGDHVTDAMGGCPPTNGEQGAGIHGYVAYHAPRPSLFDLVGSPSSLSREAADVVRFRATEAGAERIRMTAEGAVVVERLPDEPTPSADLRVRLDRVALGLTSSAETWETVRAVMGSPDHASLQGLQGAMRSHVWRAVTDRRRDDELRLLIDMLCRVSALLEPTRPIPAALFACLADLVHESVGVAGIRAVSDPMGRRAVRRLVRALARAPGGFLASSDACEAMDVPPSSGERLLDLCRTTGIVEGVDHDERRLVRLTVDGLAEAARLPEGDAVDGVKA